MTDFIYAEERECEEEIYRTISTNDHTNLSAQSSSASANGEASAKHTPISQAEPIENQSKEFIDFNFNL